MHLCVCACMLCASACMCVGLYVSPYISACGCKCVGECVLHVCARVLLSLPRALPVPPPAHTHADTRAHPGQCRGPRADPGRGAGSAHSRGPRCGVHTGKPGGPWRRGRTCWRGRYTCTWGRDMAGPKPGGHRQRGSPGAASARSEHRLMSTTAAPSSTSTSQSEAGSAVTLALRPRGPIPDEARKKPPGVLELGVPEGAASCFLPTGADPRLPMSGVTRG